MSRGLPGARVWHRRLDDAGGGKEENAPEAAARKGRFARKAAPRGVQGGGLTEGGETARGKFRDVSERGSCVRSRKPRLVVCPGKRG